MHAKTLTRARLWMAPLAFGAALVAAGPLAAQEPLGTPEPPAEEPPCVCAWGVDGPRVGPLMRMNRARLGVELGEPADVNGRTGIRLERVQDGSPAGRAGLRTGDVLLAVNGRDLGPQPERRLRELLADMEPGDTVAVTFARSGQTRTASVVTDRAREFAFSFATPPGGGARGAARFRAPRVREALLRGPDGARIRELLGGGANLVEMNPALGEYFGVSEGVLVADVPEGSTLGLRAGDVILSIGGRAVRDPGHARAIIGSYRPDEPLTMEVMRQQRRITVTGTRGER